MDIGISFKIATGWGSVLNRILNCIDSNNYLWEITNEEINVGYDAFSLHGLYRWNDLLEQLPKEEAYVIFFMAKAYSNAVEPFDTLEQFLNGNCEIAIFIIDVYEIELYCKNNDLLRRIINKISKEFDAKISIMTIETCNRKSWLEY